MAALPTCLWALAVFCMVIGHKFVEAHDYSNALNKSLLFYEAQRSGKLPNTQRVDWRSDSALQDGQDNGVDLVGAYYDAGDNVKFGLPMAHTITMLSWSLIEYGNQLYTSGQLEHAMNAIQWGTDYLLKAHTEPYVLYGEVGDGDTDHNCWQSPEDITTLRKAYKINKVHPGSDLAGETAAALASTSILFKKSNPTYSNILLTHAKQVAYYIGKHGTTFTLQQVLLSSSVYSDYLTTAGQRLLCQNGQVDPSEILAVAKSQLLLHLFLASLQRQTKLRITK